MLFAAGTALCATSEDLEAELLIALRPAPSLKRQENAGAVIRKYKAEGFIPFRPKRIDYRDYYRLTKPAKVLGHELVLLEEEYMTKFIGCCVDEGAGVFVRLSGRATTLESFAKANKCRVETFDTEEEVRKSTGVTFSLPAGSYAALLCHARDETK